MADADLIDRGTETAAPSTIGAPMIPYVEFLSNLPLRPAVVAHRGAWRFGPENSIPAVLAAADLGCEIAEIDVQLSGDGHLFLLHDDDLLRMTGHSAIAQDLPITQIVTSALRRGNGGDGSAPSDVMLPSFVKLLEAARERIYLDVDVKHDRNLAAAAAAIAASGMAGQAAIKISVRNAQEADRLRQLQDEHGLMVMPKTSFTDDNADVMISRASARPSSIDSRLLPAAGMPWPERALRSGSIHSTGRIAMVSATAPRCGMPMASGARSGRLVCRSSRPTSPKPFSHGARNYRRVIISPRPPGPLSSAAARPWCPGR